MLTVVVEQVAELLGVDPEVVDPRVGDERVTRSGVGSLPPGETEPDR